MCASSLFLYVSYFFFLTLQAEWIRLEGGSDAREHVKRVINKLMTRDLQMKINRSGSKGKAAFPKELEEMIKGELDEWFRV